MSAETGLERPHVFVPADDVATGPPLLLLHGTGGNEHDLLPLRDHLSPGAAVLSVRGTVLENGMPRFFRRIREGVFDEDDLRHRADDLRRSFGTRWASRVKPARLPLLMRHKSIETTMKYYVCQNSDDVADELCAV